MLDRRQIDAIKNINYAIEKFFNVTPDNYDWDNEDYPEYELIAELANVRNASYNLSPIIGEDLVN